MWLWGAFTPHPPIIVADVGRGREHEAQKTLDGMAALCERLASRVPETLLVLSPHHVPGRGLSLVGAKRFSGDLGQFGAPRATISAQGTPEGVEALVRCLSGSRVQRFAHDDVVLDHATLVPLLFLARVWGKVPRLIVGSPLGLGLREAEELGGALRSFDDGSSWALLASGDLSHRLFPGAPAGYSPEGKPFDAAVVEAFEHSSSEPIFRMSSERIEEAGECGLRSALVLLGFAGGEKIEVLSYEGPFGVGYCTALFAPEEGGAS